MKCRIYRSVIKGKPSLSCMKRIEDIWNINSDQEYHEEITETKDEKLSKLKTHFEKS